MDQRRGVETIAPDQVVDSAEVAAAESIAQRQHRWLPVDVDTALLG